MHKIFFLVFTEMSYRRKMKELSNFELRNQFNYVVKTKTIALFENTFYSLVSLLSFRIRRLGKNMKCKRGWIINIFTNSIS